MIELCHLLWIYYTIHLTHTRLCPTDVPPVYVTAMQTAIAEAHASILDLLYEEGFAYIVNNLPRMAVSPIFAPLLQGMSEVNCCLYFNNVTVPNPLLWFSTPSPAIPVPPPPLDREDTPLHCHRPRNLTSQSCLSGLHLFPLLISISPHPTPFTISHHPI